MNTVWDKIWVHMSEHLSEMGCHQSQSIAMRAIDAMRQLSMKFLTVENLSRDFLKPFDYIITNSTHMLIREVVSVLTSQAD
jgi:brefeldin A-inhibited guanine nucleotide-exchange protein